MNHPRSAVGAPPQGGAAGGPAEPDPRRPLGDRARYEALRAAGQGVTAKALPEPSERKLPLPSRVLHHEVLPGGWYWTTNLARGEALRIVNPAGTSSVALLAWCQHDPTERLNLADTLKVQWSVRLCKGRILYTDMGRVALSIVEDSSGAHDAMLGPTTPASMAAALGPGAWRNSRDNFLTAAAKVGLTRRDVSSCLTLFAPVDLDEQGRFVWQAQRRTAGDFVDLRAEMDLWVVLSNAGHPLDPSPAAQPAAVQIYRHAAPLRDADVCRDCGVEAQRAFEFTQRHVGARGLA